jgi:hypothetical protein
MAMAGILEAMMVFFDEDGWKYHLMEGNTCLQMGYVGDHGRWTCYAQAREEHHQFVFYSVCPVNMPEDKRSLGAEYVARVNYALIIGNFEFDFSDGEIRFKTSIDVDGDEISQPLISNCVYRNVFTTDRYLPGIFAMLYSGKTPAQAVADIETPPTQPPAS